MCCLELVRKLKCLQRPEDPCVCCNISANAAKEKVEMGSARLDSLQLITLIQVTFCDDAGCGMYTQVKQLQFDNWTL